MQKTLIFKSTITPLRALAVVVLAMIFVGLSSASWYLPKAMQEAAYESALQSNLETISQVKLMRGFYTQAVVSRALKSNTLKPSMTYHDKPDEIPLPATLVKELSRLMEKRDTTLSLVSPFPWPHRAERLMDNFEQEAWDRFQTNPEATFVRQEIRDGKRVLRVAVADKMTSEACVQCHNADDKSIKRDWKVGDVRAVFEVSRVVEPVLLAAERRGDVIYLTLVAGASLSAALIILLLWMFERKLKEKEASDNRAYFLADHDAVTGLKNRAFLKRTLDRCASGANCPYAALMLIDLDHFKQVNDTFGHAIGDKLLAGVAERLKDITYRVDVIARLGGDEFAIVRAGPLSVDGLHVEAAAVCKALGEPFIIDGQSVNIGASIGIALIDKDADNTTDLFVAADLALYAAKGAGRSQYRFFDPSLMVAALRRSKMEVELRDALAGNQFALYYQPIVTAGTGQINKIEALLRWHHPERGMIAPGEFIQVAEECGLIVPIGAWVLETACRDLSRLDGLVTVSVNLATAQIAHPSLVETVKSALEKSGLPGGRLELEITESVLLKNDTRTLQTLQAIKALGVHFAIDDFGTGYSCLSYLKDYPVDCIKIDRSFVQLIAIEHTSRALVAAIVALAKALDMATVAEGVETAEQALILQEMGCGGMQGYHFSKPWPLAEIAPTLPGYRPIAIAV